jgi:hypothetical protein
MKFDISKITWPVPRGAIVRDTYTGFEGKVIGFDCFTTGCVRIGVQPYGLDKNTGKAVEPMWVDLERIEIVSAGNENSSKKEGTGGPDIPKNLVYPK